MKKQVLILGSFHDFHAQLVYGSLAERGAAVDYLNLAAFPRQMSVAHRPGAREGRIRLANDKILGFHDIHSVYWRNFNRPEVPPLPDSDQAYIAENDCRSVVETLFEELSCRWVNGWQGYLLHQRKPVALSRVAELGVRIPRTLIGNDPDALRAFVAETGPCIFKPVQGGAHTRRISEEHLSADNLAKLTIAPITIQEEIPGTNIRVFVAGDRVFCCEVATDAVDFRDDDNPSIHPFPIDGTMAAQCRLIAKTLSLAWTGMDFRVTPDGEWVFLEANPSPMFHGFEKETKLPLLEALTDLLLEN